MSNKWAFMKLNVVITSDLTGPLGLSVPLGHALDENAVVVARGRHRRRRQDQRVGLGGGRDRRSHVPIEMLLRNL